MGLRPGEVRIFYFGNLYFTFSKQKGYISLRQIIFRAIKNHLAFVARVPGVADLCANDSVFLFSNTVHDCGAIVYCAIAASTIPYRL